MITGERSYCQYCLIELKNEFDYQNGFHSDCQSIIDQDQTKNWKKTSVKIKELFFLYIKSLAIVLVIGFLMNARFNFLFPILLSWDIGFALFLSLMFWFIMFFSGSILFYVIWKKTYRSYRSYLG